MDLVSVVIPAFNAAQYIERTLQSVRAQTHEDLEIIVVNDGSTDNTAAIVESMRARDGRIRLLSVPNGGVARARNIGINAASAEFVAFLDADDLWHRDKIKLQLACLRERSLDFGGCFALRRMIDLRDRVTSNGPSEVPSGYIFARHLCFHFVGNGSSLLVRRSAALAIGGFDPSYADNGIGGCEDLDFELRLASRFKVHGLPLYLVGYRRYEGNMSSDRSRMSRSMAETVNRCLRAAPVLPSKVKRYARAAGLEFIFWARLKDHSFVEAGKAFANLVLLDTQRIRGIVTNLSTRLLEKLHILDAADNTDGLGKLFYDMPVEPSIKAVGHGMEARLSELAEIDAKIFNFISRGPARERIELKSDLFFRSIYF